MTSTDFSSWIGRSETSMSRFDANHVKRIALTLGTAVPSDGDPLPPLWTWAIFTDSAPTTELGVDGHIKLGGFLPPVAGCNRMWAGGRVKFLTPLLVGTQGTKTSTILAIKEKEGRAGKLLFVTVEHEYRQNGELAISEEQDIVYRAPSPPNLTGSEAAPVSHWKSQIIPTSTLLFRYSAITFNTHRIHYDFPYVTEEEGYPGLVVHGPLIATYMLNGFQQANPDKTITHFSYRGLRPLISPTPFQIAGVIQEQGLAQVWAEQEGTLAHQAQIQWK
ncbi:FAS1-like dehydratase domain-containing protein [Paralcaligenes ureilyticus]|uniref:Itaconyl-CoA hydratase/mesaconyl-C4 CoA hydratase n=1 Tax=Paralcaligenes ureilyticus TaxID=627131 RepID=A0A4R3MDK1_9BURK|nr:MaoC family dehydratase N-terminal domain-containing protein [Paralcaligenes ureilyticus]TCT09605.1 itaconyl-CoA hydratase/mesaconyl-C4 CoA hydratase [Paralcaligenes ureilyticus]